LLGTGEFHEVVELASRGDRGRVDLLVRDIYPDGSLQLPGEMNASSFAKLARECDGDSPGPADLAHALMGLVGEGIAGVVGALAALTAASRIVLGGATLHQNPPLREILARLSALGRPLIFLQDGAYTAALGALLTAESAPSPEQT